MDAYVQALERCFADAPDKHRAHERAQAILQDLAADADAFGQVVRRGLCDADVLREHYPVVSAVLASTPAFELVANFWLPLPDRATDVSTKAVHHHGTMLLTTVTAFGPGYEHWTFATPRLVDPERELFALDVLEHGMHPLGHAAFVDAHVAHVPLYVPSLTVTYALWSSSRPTTWKDRVKRVPMLSRRAASLRRAATRVGLAGALELKNIEYFDFFPGDEGFVGMRERTEFQRGPAADRIASVGHILQVTGNEGLAEDLLITVERAGVEHGGTLPAVVEALRTGTPIEPVLSAGHHGIPFANFRRADIERAVGQVR